MTTERPRARIPAPVWVALAFGPALLSLNHAISEVDPAQYAEVARHLLLSGKWGHLEDAFGPFLNKPPLVFWLIALCLRVFGVHSFAVRLPSLLAGAAAVWATFRLGVRLWDRRTGLVAAAFLASSVAVQLMIADPKIDMVLTACVSLAVLCAVEARERPRWIWGAWLFGGLGLLTKGPVGLALPVLAILPEALRVPWRANVSRGGVWVRLRMLQPLGGLALVAALVTPWFVAQFDWWGWGGVTFHLWNQGIGRFLSTAVWRNDAGPFFFVHTALWAFLPMTPVLAWELARRLVAFARERALPPDWRRVVLWWLVINLVAISASSYKLPQYLFPLAPAAALLSARALTAAGEGARALRWLEGIGWGLLVAAGAAVALLGIFCFPLPGWAIGAWLAGFALAAALAARWTRVAPAAERAAAALVLATATFDVFFQSHVHSALLAFQPGQQIAALVRAEDPAGRVIPFVGEEQSNAVSFYAQRASTSVDAAGLRALLARGDATVAVMTPAGLGQLRAQGWHPSDVAALDAFPTSRPTWAFLRASTRAASLEHPVVARVAVP